MLPQCRPHTRGLQLNLKTKLYSLEKIGHLGGREASLSSRPHSSAYVVCLCLPLASLTINVVLQKSPSDILDALFWCANINPLFCVLVLRIVVIQFSVIKSILALSYALLFKCLMATFNASLNFFSSCNAMKKLLDNLEQ